jgi:hypothetical protein
VVKFDTGDNVTLLQTKPSLLCHVKGIVIVSCVDDTVRMALFVVMLHCPLCQTLPHHYNSCNMTQ